MTGPYKVEYLADSIVIRGPYTKTSPTVMSTPHIVCDHMNAAHRAAIGQAIATMEAEVSRRFPSSMESCVALRGACWYMVDAVRALLTDKEPTNDK